MAAVVAELGCGHPLTSRDDVPEPDATEFFCGLPYAVQAEVQLSDSREFLERQADQWQADPLDSQIMHGEGWVAMASDTQVPATNVLASPPVEASPDCVQALDRTNALIRNLTSLNESMIPVLDMVPRGVEAGLGEDEDALELSRFLSAMVSDLPVRGSPVLVSTGGTWASRNAAHCAGVTVGAELGHLGGEVVGQGVHHRQGVPG